MRGCIVSDQQKHVHDNMFRDRRYIGTSDFENLHFLVNSSVEINMVRADTGGDTEF